MPAASDIKTIGELVEKLKADPGAVSWAGGSAGGVDHIVVGQIAAGGRRRSDQDQLHSLFGRRRGAGGDPRRAGDRRRLRHRRVEGADRRRRASPARSDLGRSASKGFDAPTLKESGLDVETQNWRMVAARSRASATRTRRCSSTRSRRWSKSDPWKNIVVAEGLAEHLPRRRRLRDLSRTARSRRPPRS